MELRNLGKSGLRVSLVGLGCNNFGWRIDLEAARKVVGKALDLGINLLDTADMYGDGQSEEMLGQILGTKRKDVVLATKFSGVHDGHDRRSRAARAPISCWRVEASLKRLKTDWIDLYQFHRPDPRTPIEESLRALDDLVRQGKVRYIGCPTIRRGKWPTRTGWRATTISTPSSRVRTNTACCARHRARATAGNARLRARPAALFSPGRRPADGKIQERRDPRRRHALRQQANGGLGNRYMTEANWPIVEKLEAFATSRGHSILELAMGWFAANPTVSSVIAGATKPEQVEQNVNALSWVLTPGELAEIDSISAKN